jgi:hypothetical protein
MLLASAPVHHVHACMIAWTAVNVAQLQQQGSHSTVCAANVAAESAACLYAVQLHAVQQLLLVATPGTTAA